MDEIEGGKDSDDLSINSKILKLQKDIDDDSKAHHDSDEQSINNEYVNKDGAEVSDIASKSHRTSSMKKEVLTANMSVKDKLLE